MTPFILDRLGETRKGEKVRLAVCGKAVKGKFVALHKENNTLELELSKNPIFVDLTKVDAFQRGYSTWANGIYFAY